MPVILKETAAKRRINKRMIISRSISYILLTIVAIITLLPFVWTLSTSFKGQNEAIYTFPPNFIPHHFTFENYIAVWTTLPIPLYLWNSLILTFFGVLLPLILCSLAAYPLARIHFRGRNLVFLIVVSTMMIPGEVTMIPVYLIINKLNLMDTFSGVILPGAVSAFGIFLMRQAFISIPREIEESAFMDGANVWQLYWRVMMPIVKPMLATLGILSFISSWNSFLWPLLILGEPDKYPLTLGLYKLQGTFFSNTRLIAAGAVIALVPILLVFGSMQRYFVEGAYSSAVKG